MPIADPNEAELPEAELAHEVQRLVEKVEEALILRFVAPEPAPEPEWEPEAEPEPEVQADYGQEMMAADQRQTDDDCIELMRRQMSVSDLAQALFSVAGKGEAEEVRRLLAAGADPNTTDEYGWTALHWAANREQEEEVVELVVGGAELDLPNEDGATPLMLAMANGPSPVVQRLLALGADPAPWNAQKETEEQEAAKEIEEQEAAASSEHDADEQDEQRDELHDQEGLAEEVQKRLESLNALTTAVRTIASPRGAQPRPPARACGLARALISARKMKDDQQAGHLADKLSQPLGEAQQRILARMDALDAVVDAKKPSEPEPEPEPEKAPRPPIEPLGKDDLGDKDFASVFSTTTGLFSVGAVTGVALAAKRFMRNRQRTAPERTVWLGGIPDYIAGRSGAHNDGLEIELRKMMEPFGSIDKIQPRFKPPFAEGTRREPWMGQSWGLITFVTLEASVDVRLRFLLETRCFGRLTESIPNSYRCLRKVSRCRRRMKKTR